MKLVDIDAVVQPCSLPSDENLTAPRILPMLDNSMNTILNRNDISDGAKWTLYNQTLQKYLYHMKKTNVQKPSTQQSPHSNISVPRHHTPDTFSNRISDHDISGIFPMKPSIEDISQPNVRQFFEQARLSDPYHRQHESNQLSPISQPSHNDSLMGLDMSPILTPPQSMSIEIQQPEKSYVTVRNRKKRSAQHDNTAVHPHKVVSKEVVMALPANLQPTQLYRNRNRPDFYWQTTNAK